MMRAAPETITLHVPFRVAKRGGRKVMQLPEGVAPPRWADNTLVKAMARAFRWKRMLESGEFATIAELAESEDIAPSYLTRVLRLTLLAPEIVEAIVDGKQGRSFATEMLRQNFSNEWVQQRRMQSHGREIRIPNDRFAPPSRPLRSALSLPGSGR